MRYIDLTTSEIRKQLTASPVVAETSKRGATLVYPVQFVRDTVVLELADLNPRTSGTLTVGKRYTITTFVAGDDFTNVGAASNATGIIFIATGTTPTNWTHSSTVSEAATVTLGFKAPGAYDSVAFAIASATAVKTGAGTSTVYTFTVTFLNAGLDQLFATNLDEVTLVPEIKWVSLSENGETLAFDWLVQNNVIRGGESVPSYPITDTVLDLVQIARLTGGILATDLDAQLLAGYPNGKKFAVVTDVGGGILGETLWQKRAGAETVTDLGNGFILCTDGTRLYRVAG
jgi:hypothetical protein